MIERPVAGTFTPYVAARGEILTDQRRRWCAWPRLDGRNACDGYVRRRQGMPEHLRRNGRNCRRRRDGDIPVHQRKAEETVRTGRTRMSDRIVWNAISIRVDDKRPIRGAYDGPAILQSARRDVCLRWAGRQNDAANDVEQERDRAERSRDPTAEAAPHSVEGCVVRSHRRSPMKRLEAC